MGGLFSKSKHKTTSRDDALLQLKLQRDKFKQTEKRLNNNIDALRSSAALAVKDNNERAALRCLRKKKAQLNLRDKLLDNIDQIESMIINIEDAEMQLAVVERLRDGNKALAHLNSLMKLDDVQKIIDDNNEAKEYQEEIESLLYGNISESDNTSIDRELELLRTDDIPEPAIDLPAVPDDIPEKEKIKDEPERNRKIAATAT